MTDKTLTALTAAASFAATDLLYGKVGSDSRKITGTVFGAYLATATLAAGIITTSQPLKHTQTWNDVSVTFRGSEWVYTVTAAAAASTVARWLGGAAGTTVLGSLSSAGDLFAATSLSIANTSDSITETTLQASWPAAGGNRAFLFAVGGQPTLYVGSSAVALRATAVIGWASNSPSFDAPDVQLSRGGAGILDLVNGNADQAMRFFSTNSANAKVTSTSELHTLAAAATSDTTVQFPANCIPLGVTIRVTTLITGCTTLDVGISGATTKYGTGLALTANTTNASAGLTSPAIPAAATSVRFSAVGGGASFTAGVIRVTLHYISLSAATS